MHQTSDQSIDNYISQITKFSQSQRIPTPQELDRIVSELGITEEQMAEIQRVSQEHLTRADTYMKLRQWDYAIEELEKGIPLNPFSLDMLSCLGEAYLGRWCLKHKRADGVNLQTAARKCLQIQPDSPIAMSLLSRFYRYSKWRRSSQLIFGAISLGLIGGVVLAATQDSLRSLIVSRTPMRKLVLESFAQHTEGNRY